MAIRNGNFFPKPMETLNNEKDFPSVVLGTDSSDSKMGGACPVSGSVWSFSSENPRPATRAQGPGLAPGT